MIRILVTAVAALSLVTTSAGQSQDPTLESGTGVMPPATHQDSATKPVLGAAAAPKFFAPPGTMPALPGKGDGPLLPSPESVPAAPLNAVEPNAATVRRLNLKTATWGSQSRSTIGEPSCARWNNTSLMTHNWDAAVSTNNAGSWSRRNPRSFPSVDGGFCCDQYAVYIPYGGQMVAWLLQYSYSSSTRNGTQRIVIYNTEGKMASGSGAYWWNWKPTNFGYATGHWMDFPHLSYTNTYLYATSNVFTAAGSYAGTVCWRMPLSTLKTGGSLSYRYWKRTSGGRTWRLSNGFTSTMYWWQHESTTTGRLYSVVGTSTSATSRVITVNSWTWGTRGTMIARGPDNRNFMGRADSRATAMTVGRGVITVMWHAKQRTGRPYPYTRVLEINQSNFSVRRQSDIWSSTLAWTYPSAAVNTAGYTGGTIGIGGPSTHARTQAWVQDDLDPRYAPLANTSLYGSAGGPARNGWGDYLTCQYHPQQGRTWIGTGMYMNNAAGQNTNQIPVYVHFGRDRDVDTRPDLSVSSVTTTTSIVNPGFPVQWRVVYRNGGLSTSPSCVGSTRISTNNIISTGDTLLSQYTVGSISGSGGTRTYSGNSTVPYTLNLPTTSYLGAIVDQTGVVAETNEGNNTGLRAVRCNPRRADLYFTALSTSTTTLNPYRVVQGRCTIRNQGAISSTTCTTSYYMSLDSTITTSDTLVLSFSTAPLARSQSRSYALNFTVPNLRPGTCYFGGYVDRTGAVAEAFETNNTRAYRVTCAVTRPDLAPTALSISSTIRAGFTYTVGSRIQNIGNATAATSVAGYYISLDARITTADTLVYSYTTPSLARNGVYTRSNSVRIPTTIRLGTCYFGMIADRTGAVAEANESNNTRALRVVCAAGTPDLIVSALTTSPSTLTPGAVVTVTSTTRNVGGATAGNTATLHFLSTNSLITTSDTYMSGYNTGTLAVNASVTRSVSAFVPRCTRVGTCYVGAYADGFTQLTEISESNNTRAVARTCNRFVSSGRWLEFQPRYGSAATSVATANFRLTTAGPRSASQCVIAPNYANHWYVLVWSGSSTFSLDAFSNFSLSILNTGVCPSWLSRLDATGVNRNSSLNLPTASGVLPFTVYTHGFFFTPPFSSFVGLSTNALRNNIRS